MYHVLYHVPQIKAKDSLFLSQPLSSISATKSSRSLVVFSFSCGYFGKLATCCPRSVWYPFPTCRPSPASALGSSLTLLWPRGRQFVPCELLPCKAPISHDTAPRPRRTSKPSLFALHLFHKHTEWTCNFHLQPVTMGRRCLHHVVEITQVQSQFTDKHLRHESLVRPFREETTPSDSTSAWCTHSGCPHCHGGQTRRQHLRDGDG